MSDQKAETLTPLRWNFCVVEFYSDTRNVIRGRKRHMTLTQETERV